MTGSRRDLRTATGRDLVTGGVIALIGVIYCGATFSIQETPDVVTPRTFPAIVGCGLIVLGLFLAGQAWSAARRRPAEAPADPGTASASKQVAPADDRTARADDRSAPADDRSAPGATVTSTGGVVLEPPADPPGRSVVLQFALFFAYLGLLIPIGFLLSTAAFLMVLTCMYAPEKWVRNLIYSVLFSVIAYIAFVYGLEVYLPVGILG